MSLEPLVLAMMWLVFQVPRDPGLPEEDHALRPVRQRVTIGVVLQTGSPGHIRKLQQRLVALTVQFVEYPLPSTMQQVFVTEVRGEKLGISSQRSPQEHTVSVRRDVCGAQPLLQCPTIVAPGCIRVISAPFRRRALVDVLLRFTTPSSLPRADQDDQ